MTVIPDHGRLPQPKKCQCGWPHTTCSRESGIVYPHQCALAPSRLERDELFMGIAQLYAQRSTCLRGQVGAVIVMEGRPIAAGYNGAPPGMDHCLDVGCDVPDCTCDLTGTEIREDGHEEGCPHELGCQRTIHAEANAIAWAARLGVRVWGATMFSTHSPCRSCAQLIVSCGIQDFVYFHEYREGRNDILAACGVEVTRYGQ